MAVSYQQYFSIDDGGGNGGNDGTLRDISTYIVGEINFPSIAEVRETHGIGAANPTYEPTLKGGGDITFTVQWNNTVIASSIALFRGGSATGSIFGDDSKGAKRSVEYGPNSNTSGEEKLSCEVIIMDVNRRGSRGELATADITLRINGAVTEGTFA